MVVLTFLLVVALCDESSLVALKTVGVILDVIDPFGTDCRFIGRQVSDDPSAIGF